jgi:hypothetical protein
MDERTRLFLWVLLGGGFFGLLGAAFGGLTGALTWKSGRAAGTALGLAVARAFARAAEKELSPPRKGALVGATDGLAFLGVVGAGLGFFAGARHPAEWESLSPAMTAGALLAVGAAGFGLFAYAVIAGGGRAVAGLFVGGFLGAFLGHGLAGLGGLVAGSLGGAVAGTAVARVLRP